jgi:hypothetical protein
VGKKPSPFLLKKFKKNFMETYLQFAQQIPCEKLNVYIQKHGYRALDPQKVSAKEVANGLKLIVERDGMSAYQELENLISSKDVAIVDVENKNTCDCDCCNNNNRAKSKRKKLSADGDEEQEVDEEQVEVSEIKDDSAIFLKKHSTLLILVTTAIILTLIIKKT